MFWYLENLKTNNYLKVYDDFKMRQDLSRCELVVKWLGNEGVDEIYIRIFY